MERIIKQCGEKNLLINKNTYKLDIEEIVGNLVMKTRSNSLRVLVTGMEVICTDSVLKIE